MSISKKFTDDFKEYFRKHGKEMTDQEAQDAGEKMTQFAELIWDIAFEEQKRQQRLKRESKGFPVENHHTCIVCYKSINQETGWYDQNKQKCLSCQKSIEDGILPVFVCHHRASFFLMWELKSKFDIKYQAAKKLIKEGELMARVTPDGEYVFLKKENPRYFERYNAVRKSYDRHRSKKADEWARTLKERLLKEMKK